MADSLLTGVNPIGTGPFGRSTTTTNNVDAVDTSINALNSLAGIVYFDANANS